MTWSYYRVEIGVKLENRTVNISFGFDKSVTIMSGRYFIYCKPPSLNLPLFILEHVYKARISILPVKTNVSEGGGGECEVDTVVLHGWSGINCLWNELLPQFLTECK